MSRIVAISEDSLNDAAAILQRGGLVAVPTETVYGLAADATNVDGVGRIFQAKGRPGANPLISHVADSAMAQRYGLINQTAIRLAEQFWPGPLTMVVPATSRDIAPAVQAGLPTIALRQPKGAMAQLAALLDRPLAAPSANTSGQLSPTRAQHVLADLGSKVDLILDGGGCESGLESTVVKPEHNGVRILRDGPITPAMLEMVGRILENDSETGKVESPGTHFRHYAPRLPLRLNATGAENGEMLLGFGPTVDADMNLSLTSNLQEAAHNLFHMLWQMDRSDAEAIAVAPIPQYGIGSAINDRLKRAAESTR